MVSGRDVEIAHQLPRLIGQLSVAVAHWDGRGPTHEDAFAAGSDMASAIGALPAQNGGQQ